MGRGRLWLAGVVGAAAQRKDFSQHFAHANLAGKRKRRKRRRREGKGGLLLTGRRRGIRRAARLKRSRRGKGIRQERVTLSCKVPAPFIKGGQAPHQPLRHLIEGSVDLRMGEDVRSMRVRIPEAKRSLLPMLVHCYVG